MIQTGQGTAAVRWILSLAISLLISNQPAHYGQIYMVMKCQIMALKMALKHWILSAFPYMLESIISFGQSVNKHGKGGQAG